MDDLRIIPDDASGEAIGALIDFHLAESRRHSPPQNVHVIPRERMADPAVSLFTAWFGDALAGCGALRELTPSHGEIKSMRVVDACQRRGVGEAILLHLIAEARARGYTRLSLETGRPEPFQAAQRLYARHGFENCAPFGEYPNDDFSMCMSRTL